jgi:hypothetical protein
MMSDQLEPGMRGLSRLIFATNTQTGVGKLDDAFHAQRLGYVFAAFHAGKPAAPKRRQVAALQSLPPFRNAGAATGCFLDATDWMARINRR